METADLTGAVLDGRYQVLEPVAQGAMGTVYRAERLKLGKIVAVKVLHDELPDELASRQRFEIEAMAMAKLEHPNCAAVLDVGVHEGRPFVVMDFITGEDLKTLIDNGPVPVPRAISIVRQVLSGLAHAHELGIIHRDIKPANIILGQKAGLGDHVKILDFGLARLQMEQQVSKLTTGIVVGTPAYMAPEQIRGQAIDTRADLYSCGVVLFELLTGKKPFSSPKDDPIEVVSMHLKHPVPSLASMLPGTDFGEIEAVVMKSLEKPAEARYQTATEFVAALDATHRAIEQSQAISASMMIPVGDTRLGLATTTPTRTETPPQGTAIGLAVVSTSHGVAAAPTGAGITPGLAGGGDRPTKSTSPGVPLSPGAFVQRPAEDEPFTAPSSPLIEHVVPQRAETDPLVHLPPVALPVRPNTGPDGLPFTRKQLAIAGGGLLVLIVIIAVAASGGSKRTQTAAKPAEPAVVTHDEPAREPEPPVAEPEPEPTEIEMPAMPADVPATEQGIVDRVRADLTAGRLELALALALGSRKKYPENGELPFLAGTSYFALGKPADGVKLFREAIRIDPMYTTNGDLIKVAVKGFTSTPAYDAELARFLRVDIGSPAEAYLDEAATTHPDAAIRKRATDELKRYQP